MTAHPAGPETGSTVLRSGGDHHQADHLPDSGRGRRCAVTRPAAHARTGAPALPDQRPRPPGLGPVQDLAQVSADRPDRPAADHPVREEPGRAGEAPAAGRRGKTPESGVSGIKELPGKTAKISVAARGHERSRAVRLATEGAGSIALDICPGHPHDGLPERAERGSGRGMHDSGSSLRGTPNRRRTPPVCSAPVRLSLWRRPRGRRRPAPSARNSPARWPVDSRRAGGSPDGYRGRPAPGAAARRERHRRDDARSGPGPARLGQCPRRQVRLA
jgi:hypothetical protein